MINMNEYLPCPVHTTIPNLFIDPSIKSFPIQPLFQTTSIHSWLFIHPSIHPPNAFFPIHPLFIHPSFPPFLDFHPSIHPMHASSSIHPWPFIHLSIHPCILPHPSSIYSSMPPMIHPLHINPSIYVLSQSLIHSFYSFILLPFIHPQIHSLMAKTTTSQNILIISFLNKIN